MSLSSRSNDGSTEISEVTLRFLESNDLEQVRDLCTEWFPVEYPAFWYESITETASYYALAALHCDIIVGLLVAQTKTVNSVNDEDRQALAIANLCGGNIGYILTLGVRKQYRRQGIASLLLNQYIEHLRLDCSLKLQRSRRVKERCYQAISECKPTNPNIDNSRGCKGNSNHRLRKNSQRALTSKDCSTEQAMNSEHKSNKQMNRDIIGNSFDAKVTNQCKQDRLIPNGYENNNMQLNSNNVYKSANVDDLSDVVIIRDVNQNDSIASAHLNLCHKNINEDSSHNLFNEGKVEISNALEISSNFNLNGNISQSSTNGYLINVPSSHLSNLLVSDKSNDQREAEGEHSEEASAPCIITIEGNNDPSGTLKSFENTASPPTDSTQQFSSHYVVETSMSCSSVLQRLQCPDGSQAPVTVVMLHVLTTNTPAINFYASKHFVRQAFLPFFYMINDERRDGYSYVLYINGAEPPSFPTVSFSSLSLSHPWLLYFTRPIAQQVSKASQWLLGSNGSSTDGLVSLLLGSVAGVIDKVIGTVMAKRKI